ncbi:oxysterol binding protein isoform X2 [Arctopsyche grandis]|uniref:oxysterol binding protein isoform X2 n=1 Tax=Arctopsyche grandis TaxID=121162 RepID=UPI00406D8EDA
MAEAGAGTGAGGAGAAGRAPPPADPDMKGWLFKWTNYLKGYQRRWFVLSNGVLSYYRNQAEMAHTCRGTITLGGALIHTVDSCTFVISNGGTQTFHIKASNEVERQSWVTALELAKAKAIRAAESEEEEEAAANASGNTLSPEEAGAALTRELATRLDNLHTCAELIAKHGVGLQRTLADLDYPDEQVTEKATLFRIACNVMMNACAEYLQVAGAQGSRWSRLLQHEREQKQRLQEVVEQLARQHDTLEKSVNARPQSGSSRESEEEDDQEFHDAQDGGSTMAINSGEENSFIIKIPIKGNRRNSSSYNESSEDSETETVTETQQVLFVADQAGRGTLDAGQNTNENNEDSEKELIDGIIQTKLRKSHKNQSNGPIVRPHVTEVVPIGTMRQRRMRIPDKPNYPLNLWSIMKNCIGKELSKIPIPVNFSEPLSMLQRLTEEFEYSNILDIAARCTDPCEQLAYVAAFTVSSYATTSNRTGKPFNPLLGETFECDRMEDLGWRAISEQVSHHPPMVAQYCEGAAGWRCWQEFTMTSKFRGKYLQIIPLGSAYVEFDSTGNRYKWRKVTTTVHNIIVGKLWVDEHGDMEITGEGAASGIRCHLKYLPYSYFSKDTQRKVTGLVENPNGKPKWVIQGHWDTRIEIAPVTNTNLDSTVCKTGKFTTAWQRIMPPEDSDKYYNFTLLASQLNEMEDDVAPTDTRNRPDQRLMEVGKWNEANEEKLRLEEKQRAKRRRREAEAEEAAARREAPPPNSQPVWFTRQTAPAGATDTTAHVYNGDYWLCKERQDWSRCPDIY